MKKKLLASLLLAATIATVPVAAAGTSEPTYSLISPEYARMTLKSDNLYFSHFYSKVPNFTVIAERIGSAFIYANSDQYKEAVEESQKILNDIIEIEKAYVNNRKDALATLSSTSDNALEPILYYADLGFLQSVLCMTALNEYINCKQVEADPTNLLLYIEIFKTCKNNIIKIDEHIDDIFRSAVSAYYALEFTPADNAQILFDNFIDKHTTNSWHESYLLNKQEHSSDYDLNDIPAAIYLVPNEDPQKSDATDAVDSIEPASKKPDSTTQKKTTNAISTVYWVKNGKVYHKSPNCPTLDRSTNIKSGSISQSGKSALCKVCG